MLLALEPLMILVASNPSITGMRRSIRMRLYILGAGALLSISIATSPFSALWDVQFSFLRCMHSRLALTSVSSTTRTRGRAPGMTPGYCRTGGGGLLAAASLVAADGAAAADATDADSGWLKRLPTAAPMTSAVRTFNESAAATGCSCDDVLALFCRGCCCMLPTPPPSGTMENGEGNSDDLAARVTAAEEGNADDGCCCC
mmetsp:Transcript_59045/g.125453  ORF Transcript_59045/g.125453 Transcript_59045/m.125453 type:complete len:201 (-) Transcript_59045:2178-2780(-)